MTKKERLVERTSKTIWTKGGRRSYLKKGKNWYVGDEGRNSTISQEGVTTIGGDKRGNFDEIRAGRGVRRVHNLHRGGHVGVHVKENVE